MYKSRYISANYVCFCTLIMYKCVDIPLTTTIIET